MTWVHALVCFARNVRKQIATEAFNRDIHELEVRRARRDSEHRRRDRPADSRAYQGAPHRTSFTTTRGRELRTTQRYSWRGDIFFRAAAMANWKSSRIRSPHQVPTRSGGMCDEERRPGTALSLRKKTRCLFESG